MKTPPYECMVKDTILYLKERTGSSIFSIQNFIKMRWPTSNETKVKEWVKRLTNRNVLIKTKDKYKLSKEEVKKELKEACKALNTAITKMQKESFTINNLIQNKE